MEHYRANRRGRTVASGWSQRLEGWLHRQVASDLRGVTRASTATLELGAGTLNQLPYEPEGEAYDIVEPFVALYADSPLRARVRTIYADITEIEPERRYDRITSVATLEHACDLPGLIALSGLHLAAGGVFRASIPSEGTLLWTLGWKLTTGLEFRLRRGLDYGALMRHDHVNTADEIEEVLGHFFARRICRVLGFSRRFSLYRYYECRDPDLGRCRAFLAARESSLAPSRRAA